MAETALRVKRDQYQTVFDKNVPPVLTVKSGSTVILETEDAHCATVRSEDTVFTDLASVMAKFGGLNPVSGPIFVEGAEPGGCLAVTIKSIKVAPIWGKAYTSRLPDGALETGYTLKPLLTSKTRVFDIEDGNAMYPTKRGRIPLPLKPCVGTMGVAPLYERRLTFQQGTEFFGNADLPQVGVGATVVLPVNHPGALFSLGDVHGRQGEGEIGGGGMEVQADVEVELTAMSKEEAGFIGLAHVNTDEWIGSAATIGGVTLGDEVKAAYVDLVRRLERYYGFDLLDAYELLGHVGMVRIGTMNEPLYSALAMVERRYLTV